MWVGPKDAVINGIGLAWPSDTDLESPNAEPYCGRTHFWKKFEWAQGQRCKGINLFKNKDREGKKRQRRKKKITKKELAKLKQEVIEAAIEAAEKTPEKKSAPKKKSRKKKITWALGGVHVCEPRKTKANGSR